MLLVLSPRSVELYSRLEAQEVSLLKGELESEVVKSKRCSPC
jgi:hypothetical protein